MDIPCRSRPVLSIVGASAVGGTRQSHQVSVVPAKRLVGWLRQQPALYSPKGVDTLYTLARRSTTWQPRQGQHPQRHAIGGRPR